ncbi:MAG TPA: hypothetical protein DCX07_08945, partial [Phycisphaerales bacterium]|nr:hypothetical protein [Phycisphaerales bacterium]
MIPPETAPTADRRVEVPAPLLPYALLLAWCWLRDAILFAQYLAASPGTLPPWASDALAGLATLALAWGARKFLRPRFAARDLLPAAVMFLPVLLLAVARTPIPDSNFDTYAYHLYAQQFNFSDAARGFLSAGKNTFLFPLADRMFLPVRALLGYRAGTVLNVLMLGVIVLQVVQLLRDWLTREGVQPSGWLLAAGAAAAVGTEYALINVGTYLVDLLPVPLMLEALRLALDDGDNPRDVPYLAALSGFCLALKLTGVVFLAPLVAVFLLRRWRCLCVGNVAAGLILFCLPAAIYALFAWRETGNPVFWMFNEVFRSDFFLTINFRDTRWGPRGWIEKLTWPVVVLFHPERFSELARCTGRLAMLVPLGLAWAGAVWALRKTSPPVPR